MRSPFVDVHIEELILHGFPPGERFRVAEALRAELIALLGERLPTSVARSRGISTLDTGSFRVEAGGRPEHIGAHVAQAVFRGLDR